MEYAPVPTVAALPQPFPPSFPTSPQAVDLSPLEFVIAIVAVITIPALIYAFFFAIKCPNFRRRSRRSFYDGSDPPGGAEPDGASSGVKFRKEAEADVGSECPVCLSAFAEGEDIKQLSACKHAFHAACIDPWLSSHSNCPICRASTGVKRPSAAPNSSAAARGRDADLHQGLPDASSLV